MEESANFVEGSKHLAGGDRTKKMTSLSMSVMAK